MMYEFKRADNSGFNYLFEKTIHTGDSIIVKMPPVSANKRGINDIGWQTDGIGVKIYGTLSRKPEDESALWQEIEPLDEINKTISALKIENSGNACRVLIRAILN